MTIRSSSLILSFFLILSSAQCIAATIQSTSTGGAWNSTSSWAGGVVPLAADDVVIVAGATITLNIASASCTNLRLEGIFTSNNNTTLNISGNFTLAGTGSTTGNNNTRSINVNGNLLSETGANGNLSGVNLTVSGTTNLQGRIQFTNATGTKTFLGNVTIANGGAIDFSDAVSLILTANLDMSGTSSLGSSSSDTGVLIGVNSFIVNTGAIASIGRVTLAIVGLSQFNGTIIFSSNIGSKSFIGGGAIANNGGIDFTAAVAISFNNVLTMNGTSSIGTGSTATGSISSTSTFVVSPAAVATISRLNLTISSVTVQGSMITTNNNTIAVNGNWNIINAGTVNLGTGTNAITVNGNWNVADNAAVDTGAGTASINVAGNWNVTSAAANSFVEGTSTVSFLGTSSQTIATTEAGGETFYRVIFNNNSGLTTGISSSVNINTRSVAVTNGNIDMTGHDLIITGDASNSTDTFTSGSIFTSLGGSDLLITDPSINKTVTLTGTTIGSASQPFGISVTAANIFFNGADFFASGTGSFTKTGATDNTCTGGTIFTGNYSLTQALGSLRWIMQDNNPDIFINNVTLTNNSTAEWILQRATTGNEFRGATIVNNTSSGGFSFGRVSGGGSVRSALFVGPVTVNQNGSAPITFGTSDVSVSTNITFQNDIIITSTAGSSGSITFGSATGGSVTLTSSARFNTAAGSVLGSNTIGLRRLTQNGTALTQNITLSGTAILEVGTSVTDGCMFNANLNFTAPDLRLKYNTFNGTNTFTQTGSTGSNANNGGNTFASTTTFTNQGTKTWRLGVTASDDFNGNVNFIRTGAALEVASTNNSTFAGNISTVGSNAAVTFSSGASGRVTLDGTSALNADIAFPPVFPRLTLNGASFTLNTPLSISADLTFTSGIINTSATNLLTLNAGSAVSGTPSNASHVDGPIKKIGSTAFTFPTGDNGFYREIGISAPGSSTHFFTAEFFRGSHPFTNAVAASLMSVTRCEYWNLTRSAGASDVSVTLNWNTPDCTPSPYITNPAGLVVTQWNGALWSNNGNSGTTGDATTGSVTSLTTVSNFGSFALGSTTLSNPLPIELLNFTAEIDENSIDLLWSTASEHNNDYFTIQRSKENHDFESIIQLPGAANGYSNQRLYYSHKDEQPLEGISYYRLKQTDFDGRSTFSKVVKVDLGQIPDLKVYPNPASATKPVTTNFRGSFQVFNAIGQLLMQTAYTNSLDFNGFAPGVYLIRSDKGLFTRLVIE